MTPGENIRQLRRLLRISQSQLARLMGINRSIICNYEKNKRKPNIGNARKLIGIAKANKIKITFDHLIP
ncbi:MAG: helix-turn-helix domain-containing protein [Nitrosotalea sp.]